MNDLETYFYSIAEQKYKEIAERIKGMELIQIVTVDAIEGFGWESACQVWDIRYHQENTVEDWIKQHFKKLELSGECFLRVSWDEGSFHLGLFWAQVKLSNDLEWVSELWDTSHSLSLIRSDSTDCYMIFEFISTQHAFSTSIIKFSQDEQI